MRAAHIARKLAAAGFPVARTVEGTDVEDGMVEITPTVHVQVPTHGGRPGVVRETRDGFLFYPERKSLDTLVDDLRSALSEKD